MSLHCLHGFRNLLGETISNFLGSCHHTFPVRFNWSAFARKMHSTSEFAMSVLSKCVCVCVSPVCVCVCVSACIYICVNMFLCLCLCLSAYQHICVCLYFSHLLYSIPCLSLATKTLTSSHLLILTSKHNEHIHKVTNVHKWLLLGVSKPVLMWQCVKTLYPWWTSK